MLEEYIEKLICKGHSRDRVRKLLTYIAGAFAKIDTTTTAAPFPPADPDDEIFVLCALDGNADYLVSEDRALLDLDSFYQSFAIRKCADSMGPLGVPSEGQDSTR